MTWLPTPAHLRATALALALLVPGVVGGRPDLVLLAAPFVVVSVWSTVARPSRVPRFEVTRGPLTVREGEEVTWQVVADTDAVVSRVAAFHPAEPWLEVVPEGGQAVTAGQPIQLTLVSTRWGRRTLGEPVAAAYGVWHAWRYGPVALPPLRLTTLPVASRHDSTAPAPHPRGLVGIERAARLGEGTEFAKVRVFQPGDRLRRIHWPVSARTGRLHVAATYADEDTHVVLLLDAINDVGGGPGSPSSLDVTVRAAAAVAEHFLRRGDRVGLRAFGTWGLSRVPASSGRLQLRRILDSLCLVEAGTARGEDALAARLGLVSGTLAVMLTPLVDAAAGRQVASLVRAGVEVVVVDTLPGDARPEPSEDDDDQERRELAWRLRMLERRLERDQIAALGVPVVPWQGPASLDVVLRDLSRRRAVPRRVVR